MTTAKENRIEIRSSEKEKKEFEETAHVNAKSVRNEYQNITLSKEEEMRFLHALDNPPEPNKRLKKAMRSYGKTEVKYLEEQLL